MQKKLLTLAVAGALAAPGAALAQSSVEVYGFVHMAFGKWKFSEGTQGTAAAPSGNKWDIASSASNVGVRGREGLGGGLTAWFQVETNAGMERSNNIANVSGFASRNSAVGLQGGFGNVFLGQWTTPWADLDALWGVGTVGPWGPVAAIIGRRETTGQAPTFNCANGAGGGGGAGVCEGVEAAGGVGHAFWRRISNSVFYQSPVMGGVQAKLAWQPAQERSPGSTAAASGGLLRPGEGAGGPSVGQDPSMWSASVQWAGMGGRARIGAAIDRHKEFTTVGATDTGWTVKGGWNFGVADVGLAFERMTYKTPGGDCRAKQWGVAVAVPVGMGSIRGSYAKASDIEGTYGAFATTTPTQSTTGTCGPTLVPGTTASAADNGAKQWNIGYEHRFSKRTNVGVGYATIKNDAGGGGNQFTWSGAPTNQLSTSLALPNGTDISTYFVSIMHRF